MMTGVDYMWCGEPAEVEGKLKLLTGADPRSGK